MIDYKIVYSPEANTDIEELLIVITNKYSAPIAAFNYIQGLKDYHKVILFKLINHYYDTGVMCVG
jgi:hypothetical protein